MRVYYDGFIYYIQRNGGINRYFNSLIRHLPERVSPVLSLMPECDSVLPVNPRLSLRRYRRFRPERVSKRVAPWYYTLAPMLSRSDIIHPTYYATFARDHFRHVPVPVVITVHDMIHEILPELADPDGYHAEQKRLSIKRASAIICISQNTRNDLLERYPEAESRCTVVPLAADLPADKTESEPGLEPDGFLYVGSRALYKNFDGMLRALSKASAARPDISLTVVGPPPEERELRLIADLGITNRVDFIGHVDDDELIDLYRRSIALVYPSFYEGFGLPPLEAMAAGTVAVVANRSSLPEVVGDAGILFDPNRIDDLTDIIIGLRNGAIDRQPLIAAGRVRAQSFSWQRTAEKTISVYSGLIL